MKYKCIKEYKIVPEGSIIERDDNDEYTFSIEDNDIITSMSLSEEVLKDKEFFKLHNMIEITVSENELDDDIRKDWKAVFQIRCTEKQLSEIKKAIEEVVSEII